MMMIPASPAPQPARGRAEAGLVSMYSPVAPTVDGSGSDAVWNTSTPLTLTASGGDNFPAGSTSMTIRSVYNDAKVFFLVTWDDTADSYDRFPWLFDTASGKWYQADFENDSHATKNYEDKLAFIWNINNTIAGFNTNGCTVLCHISTSQGKPLKYSNAPGELGDIWHWKRVRTGPVGQVDDQYVNDNSTAPEGGRFSDPKTGGGYSNNVQTLNYTDDPANSTAVPLYYYPGGSGMQNYYVLASDKDATAVKVTGVYTNGTLITASGMLVPDASTHLPGIIISPIAGDRGDIAGTGVWAAGKWTLELSRNLVTGGATDVQFSDLSKAYYFGIAPFDNSQIGHAIAGDVVKLTFAPKMPNVYVVSVTALPASVKQGDPVTVTATLRNSGNIDAFDAEVEFYLDNATTPLGSAMANVTMGDATDATALFTWNTSGAAAGNHTIRAVVKATGLSGTSGPVLVIVPAPVFLLEELTADKTAVVLDGNLSLTVKVKNTGDLAGTAGVTILDGNATVATLSIPVAAGGSNTTVYTWKAAGAGNHTISAKLGSETKNVTVKVLTKASITITAVASSKTSLKDQPKDSTQKVTLTITLGNAGDSAGTVLLVVKEKGKTLLSENVTVGGGNSATRTVAWSLKGEGKHTATASITGDGTGSRSVDVKLGYQTPGFEAVILIAAAAAGILLLGRRRRN